MTAVYGSDPFGYDLAGALDDARAVESRAGMTEAALRKHAQRFGPDGVAEIAEAYGHSALAAELAEGGPRGRRTTPSMKEQVRALHARGLVPAAIADALNLSDSRVRRLLAQAA
ncbi:MAG: hypothetical protein ACJ752_14105 [Gaiellaceae bacterium]